MLHCSFYKCYNAHTCQRPVIGPVISRSVNGCSLTLYRNPQACTPHKVESVIHPPCPHMMVSFTTWIVLICLFVAWYRNGRQWNQQHCPSINKATTRAYVTCLRIANESQGSDCSLVLFVLVGRVDVLCILLAESEPAHSKQLLWMSCIMQVSIPKQTFIYGAYAHLATHWLRLQQLLSLQDQVQVPELRRSRSVCRLKCRRRKTWRCRGLGEAGCAHTVAGETEAHTATDWVQTGSQVPIQAEAAAA